AVVGPNGAGKTTLFRLLAGELTPCTGDIQFNGRDMPRWPLTQLARMRAVLPQSSTLQFAFTVQEVVAMGRMPHATGQRIDADIVQEVMQVCDVHRLATRPYPALSGGERQRVQLARVLAQVWQPVADGERLLLLDEPTSALDIAHQIELMQVVRRVCAADIAVLVILHDLNLAARFAHRILMLHDGRLVAQGTPDEVLQPDLIECVFSVKTQIIKHPIYGCPLVVS
ncbi:MAG TPA: heme ABC transporter ATP-binding protein, partial [Dongiaceae bacterium]|nr:heme ABC transporter ATP-binding protein [Dongiaceae bacterium]